MAEPDKKVIERLWKGYRAMCVPPAASRRQVDETRKAFYAGATALFTVFMDPRFFDYSTDESYDEPTDNDMQKWKLSTRKLGSLGRLSI